MTQASRRLSLVSWLATPTTPFYKKALLRVVDYIIGLHKMDRTFREAKLEGLDAETFCQRVMQALDIHLAGTEAFNEVPKQGAAVVVANHPYGGIEGVAVLGEMLKQRKDVRVFVNRALGVFEEISPYFIFTNPLATNAKGNARSLKEAKKWLAIGGALVVFPAGRVSYPQQNNHVTDHPWNRMVASLATNAKAPIVPIFIGGQNRPLFYALGKIYFRFRMLMLVREMMASGGRTITFSNGGTVENLPDFMSAQQQTDMLNVLTYSNSQRSAYQWAEDEQVDYQEIAQPQTPTNIEREIRHLPEEQHLVSFKHFDVYFGHWEQIPHCIAEIQRLREIEFRRHKEGSGKPQDGDEFDKTYTQLFIYDNQARQIIGAYRMGQTDRLMASEGLNGLYLSRMFNFGPAFVNQQHACLEMGRSFLIESQQRSFHGLLLLFKGIGHFLTKHPEYQTLYGTVSLSKMYQPLSVYFIERFLIEKNSDVTPKCQFSHPRFEELERYLEEHGGDIDSLDWVISQLEPDGKGIPVLVRQYHNLGAKFHCLGLDPNFAQTPGLLLSVHIPSAPKRLLKMYLGKDLDSYLARHNAG